MIAPIIQRQSPIYRWASMRTELLWVYQGPIAAATLREVHDHSQGYWVWLLSKGSVKLQMGNQSWSAEAGQWVVSPQGETLQEISEDARILSIHFRCQWPTGDNLFSGQGAEIWRAREFPRLERSAKALVAFVNRHFPKVRLDLAEKQIQYDVFLRLEMHFLEWLADFYHAMERSGRTLAHTGLEDERILKAAKLLHETPLGDAFPAAQLQHHTALGRAHLDRLFWKSFGVSTREYWQRLRQDAAQRKLGCSSYSIKVICFELGFKQPSHFTKWFLNRVGKTPKTYRDENLPTGEG